MRATDNREEGETVDTSKQVQRLEGEALLSCIRAGGTLHLGRAAEARVLVSVGSKAFGEQITYAMWSQYRREMH